MNTIEKEAKRYVLTVIRYRPLTKREIIVKFIGTTFVELIDLALIVTGFILCFGIYFWIGME